MLTLRNSRRRSDALKFGLHGGAGGAAQIGGEDLLVAADVFGAAFGDFLTMVEDDHLVGERGDNVELVLDDEDGEAEGVEGFNLLGELERFGRVHAGGGFVEQEDVGA